MMAQILYAFVGLIVLGMIMLVIGLRGKRLNDHPVCRGCGFDLEGVLPAGVTCPECGAGLKRAKAVRQGARRKRWVVAVLGMILMMLPLAAFLLVGGAILSGSDVNKYKPVVLLMLESRLAGPTLQQGAAKELLDRLRNNTLTAEQIKGAVGEAMEIQTDLKRRWFNEWGDIVEEAHLQGKVSKDEYQLFMDQSAVLDCKVRPTVEKGEKVPVVIKLKEARAGSGSQFVVSIMLDEATIGGKAAKRSTVAASTEFWAAWGGGETGSLGMLLVAAGNSTAMYAGYESSASAVLLPDDTISEGDREVTLKLRRLGQEMNALRSGSFSWPSNSGEKRGTPTSIVLGTRLVAASEPTIRMLPGSTENERRLAEALTPTQIMQYPTGVGTNDTLGVIFSIGGAGIPFAFDVYARTASKEHLLGQISSGDAAADDAYSRYGMGSTGNQRFVMASLGESVPETVDLVFKPSVDAARKTVDLVEIYGGEIVVKGVRIIKPGDR